MRRLAVLRPDPGNAATCARIAAAGAQPIAVPLFVVEPLAWAAPDPTDFDALYLTSANAVRHAGAALPRYHALPVHAVGARTAEAARAAGFRVVAVGTTDAVALAAAAAAQGVSRALHLTGRDRATAALAGTRATIPVYASVARDVPAADVARLSDSTALLHSPRAAARLAGLVAERASIRLAAISAATLAAAGPGWAGTVVAAQPDDAALVAAALALSD